MNQIERNQLEAYAGAEFARLADGERKTGMSVAERDELVQWLHWEFRRLSRSNGDKHGCVNIDRTRRVVRVRPAPQPHKEHTMGLPACLCRGDTEASLSRLGLPRTAWVRVPQDAPWAVRVRDEDAVVRRARA